MMDSYHSLAPLNAVLNGCATILLLAGFIFIKNKRVKAHRACMISAMAVSTIFLASYLTYHYHVGNVRFGGEGWIRPVYFAILIPHVILAGLIVPLAIATITFALKGNFQRHRRIARITWPLWMYVSVTGVVIYFMLYKIYTPIYPANPTAFASSAAEAASVGAH
jgi:putative membrane protein